VTLNVLKRVIVGEPEQWRVDDGDGAEWDGYLVAGRKWAESSRLSKSGGSRVLDLMVTQATFFVRCSNFFCSLSGIPGDTLSTEQWLRAIITIPSDNSIPHSPASLWAALWRPQLVCFIARAQAPFLLRKQNPSALFPSTPWLSVLTTETEIEARLLRLGYGVLGAKKWVSSAIPVVQSRYQDIRTREMRRSVSLLQQDMEQRSQRPSQYREWFASGVETLRFSVKRMTAEGANVREQFETRHGVGQGRNAEGARGQHWGDDGEVVHGGAVYFDVMAQGPSKVRRVADSGRDDGQGGTAKVPAVPWETWKVRIGI
jgi:hypothetical protein